MESKDGANKEQAQELLQLRDQVSELEEQAKEQRIADELPGESREKFRTAADWTYDWEYSVDPHGHIVYMSPSCERVTGYGPKEFMDDPDLLNRIVHPEHRKSHHEHTQAIEIATEDAQEAHEEFRIIARDGSERWIDHVCRPGFTEEGRYLGRRVSNRDITDRRKAEKALKESEQKYRTLVEESFDGIFLQKGTKIVFANKSLHDILGYEPGELVGQDHWTIYHPEDQPMTRARAQARLLGESVIDRYEVRLLSKEGTVLDGEIRAKAFSFEEEAVIQVWVRDISEQKRSKEKFQTLIENVPFGTMIIKEDGTFSYFSPQVVDMFGYAPEDVPDGSTWMRRAYPDPDYRREIIATWIQDIRDAKPGANRPRVFTVTCKDGTKKEVHFRPVQLRTGENLITLEDITDRMRAEEELQRLNRALRTLSECNQALFRAGDEVALVADICRILIETGDYRMAWIGFAEQDEVKSVRPVAQAGFEEGYLNTVNITWADTDRGRSPTGAAIRTGQPVIARNIPADPRFEPWREAAMQRGYASSAALPLKRDDRVLGALNVYAADPAAFDDEEVRLLRELADDLAYGITTLRMRDERERAESERRAAEASDRLKSAFLATMSHELRTPLNSIIGFTGIILQGLAGPLNPEQTKQLEMVRSSSRHLLALINDVLDISKIEAGQLEVARERFDLSESINKVIGIVASLAEKKGIALRSRIVPGLGEAVGDQRRVEQILLNLLNNAIKFTDSGEVALRVELVPDFKSPGGTSGQTAARFYVSDTGIGIKSDDLTTLFQPFRQIESGLSRNYEGTGLGLAICRRLVDLMGGEISAESTWEKGSTFSFTLPLKGSSRS